MATYLCVKANNSTKSYTANQSKEAGKSYLCVKASNSVGYFPLTTETGTGTNVKIKASNGSTYRIVDGTYTTTQQITVTTGTSYLTQQSTSGTSYLTRISTSSTNYSTRKSTSKTTYGTRSSTSNTTYGTKTQLTTTELSTILSNYTGWVTDALNATDQSRTITASQNNSDYDTMRMYLPNGENLYTIQSKVTRTYSSVNVNLWVKLNATKTGYFYYRNSFIDFTSSYYSDLTYNKITATLNTSSTAFTSTSVYTYSTITSSCTYGTLILQKLSISQGYTTVTLSTATGYETRRSTSKTGYATRSSTSRTTYYTRSSTSSTVYLTRSSTSGTSYLTTTSSEQITV